MKKQVLLSLLSIFLVAPIMAQQWTQANDRSWIPQFYGSRGPGIVDGADMYWATGDRVIYSGNYGANWGQLLFNDNTYTGNPTHVLRSDSRLVVLGFATVIGGNPALYLKTRNVGLTDTNVVQWDNIGLPGYTSGQFKAGKFVSGTEGFLYGEFYPSGSNTPHGVLFESTDGGDSWSGLDTLSSTVDVFRIPDNDTFYLQRQNTRELYRYTNGSETMLRSATGVGTIFVNALDGSNLVCVRRMWSGDDSLLITHDGGASFNTSLLTLVEPGHTIRAMDWSDTEHGVIVTDSGVNEATQLHVTADGGATWTVQEVGIELPSFVNGVSMLSSGGLMITSTDGGVVRLFHYGCHIPDTKKKVSYNQGNDYFFNGENLTSSGVYAETFESTGGCDSLVTINFTSYVGAYYTCDDETDEWSRELDMEANFDLVEDRHGEASSAMKFQGDIWSQVYGNIGVINDPIVNMKQEFSISTYFKIDEMMGYKLLMRSGYNMVVDIQDSTLRFNWFGNIYSSPVEVETGRWHHLVIRKTEDVMETYAVIEAYLDTALVVSTSISAQQNASFQQSDAWMVGADRYWNFDMNDYATTAYLQGAVDDLVFFPKYINDDEMIALYNGEDIEEPQGLKPLVSDGFNVFPNPANNVVHLSFTDQSLHIVRVYDLQGNEMQRMQTQSNHIQLDVSQLSAGLYFIESTNGEERMVQKLVVNK